MDTYILTGGPGTGKSSIILYLEIKLGETVIREAAEDYIRLRQAEGQKEPWTEKDFQAKLLDLQLQRQRNLSNPYRVFLDRGTADGLAYEQSGPIYDKIMFEATSMDIQKVFLIENLGFIEGTEIRRESYGEAIELEVKIEDVYKRLGHEIIRVPEGKLEERIGCIFNNL